MKRAKEVSLELLDFVGLSGKRMHLASSLTLAEKKSLELARALATRPKLILLDEVMAGLNPKEQSDSIKLIFEINRRGVTLFVIEHKMKIIMSISTRIIVLHYGEKIAEGSPEEVAETPEGRRGLSRREEGQPCLTCGRSKSDTGTFASWRGFR